MIGQLRGTLVEKQPPFLILDVHGVGYEIEAPMSTFYDLPAVGQEVLLHTHLAVKDDAHNLFGFGSKLERSLFRSLIRISGIGPKLALALLSGMRPDELIDCIENQDSAQLTRLPGVGRKTAERLVIEMKDRVADFHAIPGSGPRASIPGAAVDDAVSDAISALVSLGYKPAEASRLVRQIPTEGLPSEQIIRQALQQAVR